MRSLPLYFRQFMGMIRTLSVLLFFSVSLGMQAAEAEGFARQFLESHCIRCHDSGTMKKLVLLLSAFALIGCGEKNESGAGTKLMFFS